MKSSIKNSSSNFDQRVIRGSYNPNAETEHTKSYLFTAYDQCAFHLHQAIFQTVFNNSGNGYSINIRKVTSYACFQINPHACFVDTVFPRPTTKNHRDSILENEEGIVWELYQITGSYPKWARSSDLP